MRIINAEKYSISSMLIDETNVGMISTGLMGDSKKKGAREKILSAECVSEEVNRKGNRSNALVEAGKNSELRRRREWAHARSNRSKVTGGPSSVRRGEGR